MILDDVTKGFSFSPDDLTDQNAESFMYIMEMMPDHLKQIFLDGETDCSVFFDVCTMWTLARDTKSQHLQEALNNLLYWNVFEDDSLTNKEKEDIAALQKFFIELKEKEDSLPSGAIDALDKKIKAKLIGKKPNNFIMMLTKVSNYLFDTDPAHDFSSVQPVDILKNGKREVIVPVQSFISVVDPEGNLLPANLTPFDGEVFNGVCTLTENGQYFFTRNQIYEAFAGKSTTSEKALKAVDASMRKMRSSLISLDWTEHAKLNGLQLNPGDTVVVDDNMIHSESVLLNINGKEARGYHILKEPALFQYAKAVKQIQTIQDRKLLDVGLSNTEDIIKIKNYLLRRIGSIKNPHSKLSNTILFDTVFKACGLEVNRKEKGRKISAIRTMLDTWIKQGYIKAYEEKTEKNREITGVIIIA